MAAAKVLIWRRGRRYELVGVVWVNLENFEVRNFDRLFFAEEVSYSLVEGTPG